MNNLCALLHGPEHASMSGHEPSGDDGRMEVMSRALMKW